MKKLAKLTGILFSIFLLSACGSSDVEQDNSTSSEQVSNETDSKEDETVVTNNSNETENVATKVVVTDSRDNTIEVTENPDSVVTIGSKQTEAWLESDGNVTAASIEDGSSLPSGAFDLGDPENIDVNTIIGMQPTLVIMPSSISNASAIYSTLKSNNIEVIYCDINSDEQYLDALDMFDQIIN